MAADKAIESLKAYCESWDEGGAGDNDLTHDIRIVLAEIERLRAQLAECDKRIRRSMVQGPNVKKLITRRMAQLMVPDGGGIADGLRELATPGKRAREATAWVNEAIATVKTAPDNPFGDDEAIAREILQQIEDGKTR